MLNYNYTFYHVSESFTCTSSSFFNNDNEYSCDKIYDRNAETAWFTAYGGGRDAWLDIRFNRAISITRLSIQQVGLNPYNSFYASRFEEVSLEFDSGTSLTMTLGSVANELYVLHFEEPLQETGVRIVATKNSFESYSHQYNLPYGITDILIDGPAGNLV